MTKHISETDLKPTRREALRIGVAAGSGLNLVFALGSDAAAQTSPASTTSLFGLNAFIKIDTNGRILIYNKCPEVGQGIKTAFPMIVAEELDAAWDDVDVGQAPINRDVYGHQRAAASYAMLSSWTQLRKAGAVARSMLVTAAAREWSVGEEECATQNSKVTHTPTGRVLRYGDLAELASRVDVPDPATISLKDKQDWQLVGTWKGGVDVPKIVSGQLVYVSDLAIPDMVHAVFERCPAFGGRVVSANLEHIRTLEGVLDAFVLEGTGNAMEVMPGVAIVANSTWAAIKAKAALEVEWDEREAAQDSWSKAVSEAEALIGFKGHDTLLSTGDVDAVLSQANTTLKASYSYPFIAHASMEPQSCIAWYRGNEIEIWASSQTPDTAIDAVSNLHNLEPEKVTLHQFRAGGAFGRRLYNNFVCEAVAISQRVEAPVKLQWTREDDTRHDFYRPGGFHHISGAVDEAGRLIALRDHFVTFSHDGEDVVRVGGMKPDEFPAQLIDHVEFTQTLLPWKTPTGALRAPWSNSFAFVFQSFLHELAVAAGRDHVDFLLDVLGEPRWLDPGNVFSLDTGRAADVISLVAERAGWGSPLPEGRALGLGFYFSHATYFAEVAEVSVERDNLRIHKVTVVGDAGTIVNESGAKNQCEGSVIDGISALMGQKITFEEGRVQEGNFDQYPLLRMADAPDVDILFIESDRQPTGLGEPALPPVIPAVCNAIFSASGRRVRSLPLRQAGFNV